MADLSLIGETSSQQNITKDTLLKKKKCAPLPPGYDQLIQYPLDEIAREIRIQLQQYVLLWIRIGNNVLHKILHSNLSFIFFTVNHYVMV